MSIHDRLAALADELHLTGFGSEMNEAWKRATELFANEIRDGAPDIGALKASLEAMVGERLQALLESIDQRIDTKFTEGVKALDESLTAKVHEVNDVLLTVDQRIDARFGELLAKATAADKGVPDALAQREPPPPETAPTA